MSEASRRIRHEPAGCGTDARPAAYRPGFSVCVSLGLQLTAHEVEALLGASRPALADLAGRLDDRICRLHVHNSGTLGE
jgi:hypothetical protein